MLKAVLGVNLCAAASAEERGLPRRFRNRGGLELTSWIPGTCIPLKRRPQCCRICRKGQLCDGCITAAKKCKKEQGCACSAGGNQKDGG
jgi:hypothetical protein